MNFFQHTQAFIKTKNKTSKDALSGIGTADPFNYLNLVCVFKQYCLYKNQGENNMTKNSSDQKYTQTLLVTFIRTQEISHLKKFSH